MNNPTADVATKATGHGDSDRVELYMQLARAVADAEITRPRNQHRLRFRLEDALRGDPAFDGTDLWVLDQSSAWITKARTERAEQAAADWNTTHPVGTSVRYWTGVREGEGRASRTRTAAGVLGGHTAVVWMEGEPSCVALTHVAPEAPQAVTA